MSRYSAPGDDLKLIRHRLGSIDLSDVEEEIKKETGANERAAYCSSIHAVLPRLSKDIRAMLYSQLLFIGKEAGEWDQVLYGRGVFEGMALLLEKWERAAQEHVENSTGEDKFDKHAPLGDI